MVCTVYHSANKQIKNVTCIYVLFSRQGVHIPHKDQVDSHSQLVEESTEYRGYTNPNVQSRSFKIIQQSLSMEEADEGTFVPSGAIPGEMIVVRAYNEGKRRMEELSETHPRNFTSPGRSPYRARAQYYGVDDENEADMSQEANESKTACEMVSAKKYEGVQSAPRKRPPTEKAGVQQQYKVVSDNVGVTDSVLSPNVQGRPMVVKNVVTQPQSQHRTVAGDIKATDSVLSPNIQGKPVVVKNSLNYNPLMMVNYNLPEQPGGPSPQSTIVMHQQQPVQQKAGMVHVETVSRGPQSQSHAVIQQSKQVQYNTNVMQIDKPSAVAAPKVKSKETSQVQINTNVMQVEKAPVVVAQVAAAPRVESNKTSQVQYNTNVMPVEKAPLVVAQVATAPKVESKEPSQAPVQRRRRREETSTVVEKPADQTRSETIALETKTVSLATQSMKKQEEEAEVNKFTNVPGIVDSMSKTEIETVKLESAPANQIMTVSPADQMQPSPMSQAEEAVLPETQTALISATVEATSENEIKPEEPTVEIIKSNDTDKKSEATDVSSKIGSEQTAENMSAKTHTVAINEDATVNETKLDQSIMESNQADVNLDKSEDVELSSNVDIAVVSKIDAEPAAVNMSSETHTVALNEDVTVNETKVELSITESNQADVNLDTNEVVELSSNVDIAVVSDTSQEETVVIQSTSDEVNISNESQSVTLKLEDQVNESANISVDESATVSVDSAEFTIDTSNISDAKEVDSVSSEAVDTAANVSLSIREDTETVEAVTDTAADVNLTLNEEVVNVEAVTDVSLSLNEDNVTNITFGLMEEESESNTLQADATAADFSISLNEEAVVNFAEHMSENITQQVTEISAVNTNISEQTAEASASNKKDVDDSKQKAVETKANTSNNDSPKSSRRSVPSDKKTPPSTGKAKFIDSQGGVQARLARLKKK